MKIKTVLISATLFFGFYIIFKRYTASKIPITYYDTPIFSINNKPIILWDIHNVIIKKDIKKIMTEVLYFDQKVELVKHLSIGLLLKGIYLVLKSPIQSSTSESLIVIARQQGNNALADLALRISNAQSFIPGTRKIIKQLHEMGYEQHIGSNIGKNIFEHLKKTPYFFPIFNEKLFDLRRSHIVKYSPGRIIEKPNKLFFVQYLQKNKLKPSDVVLIDDQRENVAAAQKIGMYAIYFNTAQETHNTLWLLLGL